MTGFRSPYATSNILWRRGTVVPMCFVLVLALVTSFGAASPSAADESSDPAAWRGGIGWEHVFVWDDTDEFTGNRHYGTQTRQKRWDFVGDGDANHPEGTQTAVASYDRLSTQIRRTWTGTGYVNCTTVTSQTFTQIGDSENASMRVGFTPSSESWWGSGTHRIYGTWRTVSETSGPDGCTESSYEHSREDYFQAAGTSTTAMVPLPAPQDAQKLSGVVSTSDATNNNVWRTTWNLARGDAEPDPWPDDNGESNGDNGDEGSGSDDYVWPAPGGVEDPCLGRDDSSKVCFHLRWVPLFQFAHSVWLERQALGIGNTGTYQDVPFFRESMEDLCAWYLADDPNPNRGVIARCHPFTD